MKIDTVKQFLGFHILADVDLFFDWHRFYCLAGGCEEKFSSKRKLKNHIDFECEYSGKQFFFGGKK